jgi:uncharacterized protein
MRLFNQQLAIDFIGQGGFRFGEMSHIGTLLSLPSGMQAIIGLTQDDLSLSLESDIDFFILGTGEKRVPPDKTLHAAFRAKGISLDSMATPHAVSTYNVLLDEKRRVGAAFVAV